MKVEMGRRLHPRRGGPVLVGNIYSNPHGRNYYKVVVNVLTKNSTGWRQRYTNVIMLHVDTLGNIVGSSNQPETYVSEHQDLVGKVKGMPTLKLDFFQKD